MTIKIPKKGFKKAVVLFLNVILTVSLLFQSVPVSSSPALAYDPFSLTPEKKGLFQGLPDKLKGLFDSSTQKLNGLFKTLQQKMGGASEGSPAPPLPQPEYPYIPISADLIQVDATWSANCIPDMPPDEYLPSGGGGGTCYMIPTNPPAPQKSPEDTSSCVEMNIIADRNCVTTPGEKINFVVEVTNNCTGTLTILSIFDDHKGLINIKETKTVEKGVKVSTLPYDVIVKEAYTSQVRLTAQFKDNNPFIIENTFDVTINPLGCTVSPVCLNLSFEADPTCVDTTGDTSDFSATITNNCSQALTNTNLTYFGGAQNLGTIAAGSSSTIDLANKPITATITETATVTGTLDTDSINLTDTTTVVLSPLPVGCAPGPPPASCISFTKTAIPSCVENPGEDSTFTLSVTNNCTEAFTISSITDNLAPGGVIDITGHEQVPVSGNQTFTYSLTVFSPLSNTANLSGTLAGGDVVNLSDSADVAVGSCGSSYNTEKPRDDLLTRLIASAKSFFPHLISRIKGVFTPHNAQAAPPLCNTCQTENYGWEDNPPAGFDDTINDYYPIEPGLCMVECNPMSDPFQSTSCPDTYQCPERSTPPYTNYTGCEDNPTTCDSPIPGTSFDACWGLYPSATHNPYDGDVCLPADLPTTTSQGDMVNGDPRTYEVPSQTITQYTYEECNRHQSMNKYNRPCAPEYTYYKSDMPTCYPTDLAVGYGAYARKLNGCNALIEPTYDEDGNAYGISPPSSPSRASPFDCSEKTCNATDGPRCVQGTEAVCRKAIQIKTCEQLYTTTDEPPSDNWGENCVVQALPAQEITCGNAEGCETNGGSEYGCTTDDICTQEVSHFDNDPDYDCDGDGSADCCTECNADGTCDEDPGDNDCGGSCCNCDEGYDGCLNFDTSSSPESIPPTPESCSGGNCTCDPGDNPGQCADADNTLCSDNGETGCAGLEECCKLKEHWEWPLTSDAIDCAVYQYTERHMMYRVLYYSNMITIPIRVRNLSDHVIKDPVTMTVDLPDFVDLYDVTPYPEDYVGTPDVDPDPENKWVAVVASHPDPSIGDDLINNMATRHMYWTEGTPGIADGPHGGTIKWTFWNEEEKIGLPIGADYTFNLRVVPSDENSAGYAYYGDHYIGYNGTADSELNHYINNLFSDNRLLNLNYQMEWSDSKVIELQSFWIGSDVVSNASPGCAGEDGCFIDPNSRPFGYPVTGTIAQDWGGIEDINTDADVTWSNPLAQEWGPRYGEGQKYTECSNGSDDYWSHMGIDLTPIQGEASETEVYSTHAGHVTEAECFGDERGCSVTITSNVDDDCWPEFVTSYNNLMPELLRVLPGEYVPRHKLLGLMGATGRGPGGIDYTGFTHTNYQIRYPVTEKLDIYNNNCPAYPPPTDAEHPNGYDPPSTYFPIESDHCSGYEDNPENPEYVDPLTNDFYNIKSPEEDAVDEQLQNECNYDPYICETPFPNRAYATCKCLTSDCDNEFLDYPPYFFCENKRQDQEVNRCFYDNPTGYQKDFSTNMGPVSCPIQDPDPFCNGTFTSFNIPGDHGGFDWTNRPDTAGTPVYSVVDGQVVKSGCQGGYGNAVVITDGTYDYYYGHLSPGSNIGTGPVSSGDQVGVIGMPLTCAGENSTGPHLHFEVRTAGGLCYADPSCTIDPTSIGICGPTPGVGGPGLTAPVDGNCTNCQCE